MNMMKPSMPGLTTHALSRSAAGVSVNSMVPL